MAAAKASKPAKAGKQDDAAEQSGPVTAPQIAEAIVQAQTKANENAVLVNKDSKSRAQRRSAIEEELREKGVDDEEPRAYIAYSTEICPHAAPTVADCDFPKFIYKRGKRNQPDQAVKKVVWLTDFEAERIREFAEIKFMEVDRRDEEGNVVLDKRTGLARKRAVPYSSFIRLVPTSIDQETGVPMDDPAEAVHTAHKRIEELEAELAEFRSGGRVSEEDVVIEEENKRLKNRKMEAELNEAEAIARDPDGASLTSKSSFRKKGGA